jgi:hypothetical protein
MKKSCCGAMQEENYGKECGRYAGGGVLERLMGETVGRGGGLEEAVGNG